MKSIVVYFSQTGNTRKIAMAIQQAIKATTGQCDIIRLKEATADSLAGYDLIGLGCPTFAHKEPYNVAQFIKSLKPLKGKLCFIFATHAGHPSNVLPSMAAKLRRQGLRVLGGFNCDGSICRPFFTSPWYTDEHPDNIDDILAADFACTMVGRGKQIAEGGKVPMAIFHRLDSDTPHGFLKIPKRNMPMSRGFEVRMTLDQKRCRYPKCHICVDNCPMDAIDLAVRERLYQLPFLRSSLSYRCHSD